MREVYDYGSARTASTPDQVRWVLGLFFELYGVIECEVHMRGAYSGGPEGFKTSTFWAQCIHDEELELLLAGKFSAGVYIVPIKNIPS